MKANQTIQEMSATAGHNISKFHKQITLAGSLIAVGIVFGDIGTSPLYTLNSVFHGRVINGAVALCPASFGH